MKKIISLFTLSVLILSFLLPVSVFSAEVTEGSLGGDTYWKFDEKTGELTVYGTGATEDFGKMAYLDDGTAVTSPLPEFSELKNDIKALTVTEGITSLGTCTFYGLENCEVIALPDSLISIGNACFSNCKKIKSLSLPDSLTSIGSRAFSGCSDLESIIWPPKVTVIKAGTFESCTNLKEFEIPSTVEHIEAFAVLAGIEKIDVPSSVTFDNGAFSNILVEEIVFEDGRTHIPAVIDCNPNLKKVVIPKSVETIDNGFFGTYPKLDIQICYEGTAEEFDSLLKKTDPWFQNLINECEIVTDYAVEKTTATDDDISTEETTNPITTTNTEDSTSTREFSDDTEENNDNGIALGDKKFVFICIGACAVLIVSIVVIAALKNRKNK